MFKRFQPPASPEPETEETPSVMRHEESPELPDILPPLSSSCQCVTKEHCGCRIPDHPGPAEQDQGESHLQDSPEN